MKKNMTSIIEQQAKLIKQLSQNTQKTDNIIESSMIEKLIFSDKKNVFKEVYKDDSLEEIEFEGSKKITSFKGLTQDVFNLLFQVKSTEMNDEKLTSTAKRFNKELVSKIRKSGELNSLRLSTQGNSDESIDACSIVMNDIYEKLDSYMDEIYGEDLSEESIKNLESILEEKRKQLKNGIQKYNTSPIQENQEKLEKLEKLEKNITKLDREVKGLENKIEKINEEVKHQSRVNEKTILEKINNSFKNANEEIELNKTISSNFAVGKGKSEKTYSIEENKEVIKNLKENSNIMKISQMLGQLKLSFEKSTNGKFEKNRGEIIGVERGDDLNRVISSEWALLATPETELLFYTKYAQKELLQYKRGEKKDLYKGNCIVLADESSSTSEVYKDGYSAYFYTKAVSIALANILTKQNRSLLYVPFDDRVGEEILINKETHNVNTMSKLATNFLGGGTDYNLILTAAIENYFKNDNFKKTDILFITDGEDRVDKSVVEEFNRLKKERKVRCIALILDKDENIRDESVKQFADKILKLSELGLEKTTDTLFNEIV